MNAYHEKRMAVLVAHQKRMMACLRQTEANTEKIDPGMMHSAEEHQDIPTEDVPVMPVENRGSGVGSGSRLQGDAES
jgi:hypothetical protein